MLPDKPENDLVLFAGDRDSIAGASPNNIYSDYLPAPDGSYSLVVKRAVAGAPTLQRLPVVLPPGEYISVLASMKNGQPTVEVFDDTPNPQVVELSGRLVVRQFCPGAQVKVVVTGVPPQDALKYGDTATIENIPATGPVNISVQAVMATTPPTTKNWPLTADFSSTRHATLLVVAGPYGRLRPQLCYDGQSHDAAASSSKP